ncbi:MAG TPA: Lpg1974 family pore-forming outer membrane protein [Gemmataceae bacterium]
MKPVLVGLLALGIAAALAGPATGQVLFDGVGGTQITLEALDGGAAFPAAGGVTLAATETTVTANTLNVIVGFNYLRPYWAGDSLRLAVPPGSSPALALVGATGDVANSFGLVPRLEANYDLSEFGIAAAASAEFVNLNGTLERTVSTLGGSADLNASYNLTLVNANLVELGKSAVVGDLFPGCREGGGRFADDLVALSVGTRFSSLQQTYRSAARSGTEVITAEGNQSFAGFGVTTSLGLVHPVSEALALYNSTRASVLIGPNNRKSVVATAGVLNNSLIENETLWMPVVEAEAGVQYVLGSPGGATAGGAGPLVYLRAGLVGQVWGLAGFLPAGASGAGFGERPLYLVGFTLSVGTQW